MNDVYDSEMVKRAFVNLCGYSRSAYSMLLADGLDPDSPTASALIRKIPPRLPRMEQTSGIGISWMVRGNNPIKWHPTGAPIYAELFDSCEHVRWLLENAVCRNSGLPTDLGMFTKVGEARGRILPCQRVKTRPWCRLMFEIAKKLTIKKGSLWWPL